MNLRFTRFTLLTIFLVAALCPVARTAELPPIVNVHSSDASLYEGQSPSVTLSFSTDSAAELTIRYAFQGAAVPNEDYRSLTGEITNPALNEIVIPQNRFSNSVKIQIIDDLIYDPNESITVRILPDPKYIIGSSGALAIKIVENEFPPLPNIPPSMTMTNREPLASTRSNWVINAYASDRDGYIAQLAFFSGADSIGVITNNITNKTIFTFQWTNPPPGFHSVHAIATDNQGASASSRNVTVMSALEILQPALQGALTTNGVYSNSSAHTADGRVGVVEWQLPDFAANAQALVFFCPQNFKVFRHQLLAFEGLGQLTTTVFALPKTFLASFRPLIGARQILDVTPALSGKSQLGLMLTNDNPAINTTTFANFGLALFPTNTYDIPTRIQWLSPKQSFTIDEPIRLNAVAIDSDTEVTSLEILDEFGPVGVARHESSPGPGTNLFSVTLTNIGLGNHLMSAAATPGTNYYSETLSIGVFLAIFPGPPALRHLNTGSRMTTCYVVDSAGRAQVWGRNTAGELGLGFQSLAPAVIPHPITMAPPPGLKWRQISADAYYALALADDHSLWGWGNPRLGQFGIPGTNVFPAPIKIPTPRDVALPHSIAAGSSRSFLLDAHTQLWILEQSNFHFHSEGWSQISVGRDRAVGIRGRNIIDISAGQTFRPPDGEAWNVVSTAGGHTLALTGSGQLYAWGDNTYGQLPFSGTALAPRKLSLPGINRWSKIAAGTFANLAVDDRGKLYSWGLRETGSRNPVRNRPSLVDVPPEIDGWLEIHCADTFRMALSNDGRLFAWGAGIPFTTFPTEVAGLPNILDPNETRLSVALFGLTATPPGGLVNIVGQIGSVVSLQSSPDFFNWSPVMSITNGPSVRVVEVPNSTGNSIFYRLAPP